MSYCTRFAPSPTGPLHLGHAFSAGVGHIRAQRSGGKFLVRIEDLDQTRAREEWEDLIHSDLAWLGISYPTPVMRQSERDSAYEQALTILWDAGMLFPCTCTRRDIMEASAPQEGSPLHGPDGVIYPGTCRREPRGPMPAEGTLRLNIKKAAQHIGTVSFWEDSEGSNHKSGWQNFEINHFEKCIGDVVVRRRDMGASYHLAVVVDDAAQGITEVVRGSDLFDATAIHVVLQNLLGLPVPRYHHHRLIRDQDGKRLAKRDDARSLATLREAGWTPTDVWKAVEL